MIAVSREQIAAATLIHDQLMPGWAATDRTLVLLAARVPEMDDEAVLLKGAAINELYSAQCRYYGALIPIIVRCVGERPAPLVTVDGCVELVTTIAGLGADITGKWYWSFCSKFVHWFVCDRAPMYDRWSREALRKHVGALQWGNRPEQFYGRFVSALQELRTRSGLTCTARELDRYLWLSGMYQAWLNAPDKQIVQIAREVRDLFGSSDSRARAALNALMTTSAGTCT